MADVDSLLFGCSSQGAVPIVDVHSKILLGAFTSVRAGMPVFAYLLVFALGVAFVVAPPIRQKWVEYLSVTGCELTSSA